jgi:hypothetical protein
MHDLRYGLKLLFIDFFLLVRFVPAPAAKGSGSTHFLCRRTSIPKRSG